MQSDHDDDAGVNPDQGGSSPLRALAELRSVALERDQACRRDLALAALAASGEVGYRRLSVRLILERTGISRTLFYRLFDDKAACYSYGYELAIEALAHDLLAPARRVERWQEGFGPGLEALAGFLEGDPLFAKGLLAEVHVAGDPAMGKRKEVFERLSRAIDVARRENESRHSPPPITAEFILRAIEEAVISALLDGGPARFAASVPDLTYIATTFYFGEEEAQRTLGPGTD
ncbi:MAG TPA: TetR/AcrR family transcriptional regulator [Solirubrobacterales bacterium]|nr:TetR/AcrR family transcriptional regulator [Solirubrobacterales bacterium]